MIFHVDDEANVAAFHDLEHAESFLEPGYDDETLLLFDESGAAWSLVTQTDHTLSLVAREPLSKEEMVDYLAPTAGGHQGSLAELLRWHSIWSLMRSLSFSARQDETSPACRHFRQVAG